MNQQMNQQMNYQMQRIYIEVLKNQHRVRINHIKPEENIYCFEIYKADGYIFFGAALLPEYEPNASKA